MELATRQLLRAIRGNRSQVAFARRLGYRGNPIADWEAGRRTPTAEEMLRACERSGIDTRAAFRRFHPAPPPSELEGRSPRAPAGLAGWLNALRGSTPILLLAKRSGHSRYSVGRWLSGQSRPRVDEFLRLVEAITGRACDLVAELVPIAEVPALQSAYEARAVARRLAHDEPWTEAILRVLESRPCKPGETAAQLDIDSQVERDCIDKLRRAGIVHPVGECLAVVGELSVDTRAAAQLKAHWASVAKDRLQAPEADDLFMYNVLSAAPEDVDAIRELLRATYRQIRTLVSSSTGADCVALVNLQLLTWPAAGRRRSST